jgi:hypothetical protein
LEPQGIGLGGKGLNLCGIPPLGLRFKFFWCKQFLRATSAGEAGVLSDSCGGNALHAFGFAQQRWVDKVALLSKRNNCFKRKEKE